MSKYENTLIVLLRYSLAIIFIWFGLLKVFGFNPVYDLIAAVSPWLAHGTGLILLGLFETLIGVGLVINKFPKLIHVVLVLHLAGTFLTFFTGWNVVFDPYFPVLSIGGEFVIKNLTLAIAGLVVLFYKK